MHQRLPSRSFLVAPETSVLFGYWLPFQAEATQLSAKPISLWMKFTRVPGTEHELEPWEALQLDGS